MNITNEKTGELTSLLKIQLVEEDYKESVDKSLKDYQKKANMPGFRPGKVPFGMIKKMYGRSVIAEEINKVLADSLSNYISENKIEVLGNPLPSKDKQVEIDFEEQKEFDFYFDLGIKPEINIEISEDTKADIYSIKIDDALLEKFTQNMQKRHGNRMNPEETDVEDIVYGDIVELDENKNEVEEGISRNSALMIDFVKDEDIKKKFIGLKIGDILEFNPAKAFDNDTETSSFLGVEVSVGKDVKNDFKFSVTEISRMDPIGVNKELFDKVFPGKGIETEEDFTEAIKKDAEQALQAECDGRFMYDLKELLLTKADITLPDEFLKRWLLESSQNEENKISQEEIDDNYEQYANTLKWQLIENKVIKENEIDVKPEDVKEHIKDYFQTQFKQADGDEEKAEETLNTLVDSVMQNQEEVKKVYDHLFDKKMLEVFKSKLKLENKDISYKDFLKLAVKK